MIASFSTGPDAPPPMRIYSQVRLGVTPQVNMVSTLLLAVVEIVLALSAVIRRRTGFKAVHGTGRGGFSVCRILFCLSAYPRRSARRFCDQRSAMARTSQTKHEQCAPYPA
ncbi:MAG: hypothetical protein ACLP7Q_20105 [Isosphaeraceae bacterium]